MLKGEDPVWYTIWYWLFKEITCGGVIKPCHNPAIELKPFYLQVMKIKVLV